MVIEEEKMAKKLLTTLKSAFEVDIKGLRELFGSTPAWRHAVELVTNVFDEFLGYQEGMVSPTSCVVTLTKDGNRPAQLTVKDDGGGFKDPTDIYTLFRTTEKRKDPTVSGRFNAGEKQLIAVSREAVIMTRNYTVKFINGVKTVTKHKDPNHHKGTTIEAVLPMVKGDFETALEMLSNVIPPEGINYVVNGEIITRPVAKHQVEVTLPTVVLQEFDGMGISAMKKTNRKTKVEVFSQDKPWLYELGIPVMPLEETAYSYSLNVNQKIPMSMSRDLVKREYIMRLIGLVNEASALDDVILVSEEDQGANFEKESMSYVKDGEALSKLHNTVRPNSLLYSSNISANILAQENGLNITQRGTYDQDTLDRLKKNEITQSTDVAYGNYVPKMPKPSAFEQRCPKCGFVG